ncbi:lytic polysaccharide monooxygenase [Paenibacillus arenosi]|uniref:Lytic polysaccharide monooxygenase n=1 Tax=Paenibacillus arenosi TaxID=2774142 RepID=A0ABR9AW27_9BACL|nr:lytic polysaccharide monooxygenase [Paenibacillus arenosi]MBD8497405.1 lytic polysaccharide monooxygenase [Paenibacillus arenosi]
MIQTRTLLNPFKSVPFLAAFAMTLLLALISVVFAQQASAHGYIESPKSRSYKCNQLINVNCGQVQYNPHDIEGPKGFPSAGPADGQITSAGRGTYSALNAQTSTRWDKTTLSGGPNTFKWHLTTPHATTDWKYYITKKNWDPNQPIKRSDLELLCTFADGGATPATSVSHTCNVPTDRTGYHVILGTWDVFNTNNAFYQAIDVNLVNSVTALESSSTPGNIASIIQSLNNVALNTVSSNQTSYFEVFHNNTV